MVLFKIIRNAGRLVAASLFTATIALASAVSPSLATSAVRSQLSFADGPDGETAVLQNKLEGSRDLAIRVGGRTISALPARLRVDAQWSPLAYSTDYRRQANYGQSWRAISVYPYGEEQEFFTDVTGVYRVDRAVAIARGSRSADIVRPPESLLEFAARQVAIWNATAELEISRQTVPSPSLRREALRSARLIKGTVSLPIQSTGLDVQIFLRDVTANSVTLVIRLDQDANRSLCDSASIDLGIDGQIISSVRTGFETRLDSKGGFYVIDDEQPLSNPPEEDRAAGCGVAGDKFSFAYVQFDRNISVVDVSATWVNVKSDPGLLFGPVVGSGPPLLTAEDTVLSSVSSTRLDPDDYGGPSESLNRVGSEILARLSNWQVWIVLLVGLYAVSRLGNIVDLGFKAIGARYHKWRDATPSGSTTSAVVIDAVVEGRTVVEAIERVRPVFPQSSQLGMEIVDPTPDHVVVRVSVHRSGSEALDESLAADGGQTSAEST